MRVRQSNTMEYKITERKKEIKVKIFNIKLISKERKGTEAYIQLIERVFKNWPRIDVGSHRAIEFMRTTKDKDILLYYGQIIKYTILDDENWYNRKTNQLQSYEIDDDMYPNSVECKFFSSLKFTVFVILIKMNSQINKWNIFYVLPFKQLLMNLKN